MIDTNKPVRKKWLDFTPETVFLLFGLIFGVLFCIFVPYGAGFDEEQHVVRIYDISGLHFLPNRSSPDGTLSFNDFISLSYQRRYYQTPANDLFLPEKFLKPVNRSQMVAFLTRSIYPPVNFLPQAVIAGIFWRFLTAPVIPVAILCRLAGLLLYLLGCYFAIRFLPFGKWVLTFTALAPMALFQASTLNADGFMNALSFIFIGLTLNIYANQESPIPPLKIWLIAAFSLLLGLSKPGAFFILPLLLLIPFRRIKSKFLLGLILVGVIGAVVITLGYNALSINGSHFSDDGGQSLSKQLATVKSNPLDFINTFVLGNVLAIGRYFRNWTASYGYWNGIVPEPVFWLFPLALIGGLLLEPRRLKITKYARFIILGVFLFAAAATAFLYSYLHYSPGDLEAFGKQGRYFIPMTPLLFLSVAGLLPSGWSENKWLKNITIAIFTLVIGLYSLGLFATYYTFCGSTLYTFGACTQPVYKNLDISTTPTINLTAGESLTQGFLRTCKQFNSVDVYVKSVPAQSKGIVRYSILDNNSHPIASRDVPVASIQPGANLNIPALSTEYQLYKIKLETIDFSPGEKITLATNEDSSYGNGDLIVAGAKQETDLIFQFTCNTW